MSLRLLGNILSKMNVNKEAFIRVMGEMIGEVVNVDGKHSWDYAKKFIHIQETKPYVMFLLETRCDHKKIERWHVKFDFSRKLVVDSTGKSSGLCLFWYGNVVVDLLTYSPEHIDVTIQHSQGPNWRFTGFYYHPGQYLRMNSWSILSRLAGLIQKAHLEGKLTGFKCSGKCPIISHLIFADDSLLFTKAYETNCLAVKYVLDVYARVLGQLINFNKCV
ncbi:hypothetical protein Dsin_000308 [Dipteronia sinensis]|uniref:Reverse transcriptase domain-containing protein n=1 Tax=Dipteronia sinensis TaxID=43782 RepID=A0AAE0EHX5_9ROSI|nr:hypothetical protein Dsin_000308 [Dipteronia sinensis]